MNKLQVCIAVLVMGSLAAYAQAVDATTSSPSSPLAGNSSPLAGNSSPLAVNTSTVGGNNTPPTTIESSPGGNGTTDASAQNATEPVTTASPTTAKPDGCGFLQGSLMMLLFAAFLHVLI